MVTNLNMLSLIALKFQSYSPESIKVAYIADQ